MFDYLVHQLYSEPGRFLNQRSQKVDRYNIEFGERGDAQNKTVLKFVAGLTDASEMSQLHSEHMANKIWGT